MSDDVLMNIPCAIMQSTFRNNSLQFQNTFSKAQMLSYDHTTLRANIGKQNKMKQWNLIGKFVV